MSEQVTQADTERLTDLRARLKSREGKPGYTHNVEALKAEIARLTKTE